MTDAPPIGGQATRAQIASRFGISVRMLERGIRILRRGIPELIEMVERGELKAGPAEIIADLPHEEQRNVVAQGVAAVRRLAGTTLRGRVSRHSCPHCGGEL